MASAPMHPRLRCTKTEISVVGVVIVRGGGGIVVVVANVGTHVATNVVHM